MASRPFIRESLMLLNVTGINPHKQNMLNGIKLILSSILLGVILFEVLLKCISEWQGFKSVQGLVVSLGLYQVLFKLIILTTNRTRLNRILNNMEKFWPVNGYQEKLQKSIDASQLFAKVYMRIMLSSLVVFLLLYFGKPFLSKGRSLPLETYHPKELKRSPDYELMYTLQYALILPGAPVLVGFDLLFVSLIVTITCELKILRYGFSNIKMTPQGITDNFNGCWIELSRMIDHHNLTLECIKDLNKIYSIVLLNVFLLNTICICVGLLSIIASGFPKNLSMIPMYGFYVIFYSGQLFFYCMGGSHLITESEEVSSAIYKCNWWTKTQPQLRNACVLITQRANKTEKLTAGGMFVINLENFTKIMKTAFSFFTLVHAVFGEE